MKKINIIKYSKEFEIANFLYLYNFLFLLTFVENQNKDSQFINLFVYLAL